VQLPPPSPPKTNGTSVVALLASLSGFVCFLGFGGMLGVTLGLIARSEIRRSSGRETGTGLATGAIILGSLNIVLAVVGLAVGFTYLAQESSRSLAVTPSHPFAPSPSPSPAPAPAPVAKPPSPRTRASRETGSQVTVLGSITLVDSAGDLATELSEQRAQASAAGEIPVLWLVMPNCKPCDGVAAALTEPQSQKALAKVRLIRVDAGEFQVELEQLGIPTEKIPGFVLLDGANHPRDFIHGGEWDADIAPNIAPVLGKFVHGSYRNRRFPWHGAVRDDETPT